LEKAEKLQKAMHVPASVVRSVDEMVKLRPKVIVEAASQQAARDYAAKIVAENIELIVMSVGALLDLDLRSNKIHTPSGAIGGLDALSSAALAGVEKVNLITRKNPKSLGKDVKEEKVEFEGYAEEAVKLFPREMNVAGSLALVVRPVRVEVKVISDPKVQRINHEVKVKWKLGSMVLKFENDPHPDNPRTSALAAWSAIRLLKTLLEK
jgi:aspartate dehydrogenase